MECVEIWTGVVQNVCVAAASLVGIYVGLAGLRTWKEQLRGTREYELARRIMLAALVVREKIARARSAFITPDEQWSAMKSAGMSTEDIQASMVPGGPRSRMTSAVYGSRWNEVADGMTELRAAFLEAEALWGSAAGEALKPMAQCAKSLRWSIMQYQRVVSRSESPGGRYENAESIENEIWDQSEDGKPDAVTTQVNAAIAAIEDLTREHLRR